MVSSKVYEVLVMLESVNSFVVELMRFFILFLKAITIISCRACFLHKCLSFLNARVYLKQVTRRKI